MLFKFVFLCLFWRFVPRENGIFEKKLLNSLKSRQKRTKLATWKSKNHPSGQTFRPKTRICPIRSYKEFIVRERTVFQLRLGQI